MAARRWVLPSSLGAALVVLPFHAFAAAALVVPIVVAHPRRARAFQAACVALALGVACLWALPSAGRLFAPLLFVALALTLAGSGAALALSLPRR